MDYEKILELEPTNKQVKEMFNTYIPIRFYQMSECSNLSTDLFKLDAKTAMKNNFHCLSKNDENSSNE